VLQLDLVNLSHLAGLHAALLDRVCQRLSRNLPDNLGHIVSALNLAVFDRFAKVVSLARARSVTNIGRVNVGLGHQEIAIGGT